MTTPTASAWDASDFVTVAGELNMELLRPVPLAGLIEQSLLVVRSTAEATGVRIEAHATDQWVAADPDQLLLVLAKVLSGAARLSSRGARLTVAVESLGQEVEIRVTGVRGDDGLLGTARLRLPSAAAPLVDPFLARAQFGVPAEERDV
jgi:hypothetical protein